MRVVDLALCVAALPALLACAYLATLTALSQRMKPVAASPPHLHFAVVVPAHDEEQGIGATIASLAAMDYPRDRFRVIVVADNCSDDTARKAREAGASVLERRDPTRLGKGHALAFAFETLARDPNLDAIAVVDADTLVSANLLSAFTARIERGDRAVQASYGVRNVNSSWRTRLATIAFATFHELRSLGRERLGVSCGLRGNGMCFTTSLLREVPYDAFSVVEDLEAGIRLAEHGCKVRYASEAHVYGEMASNERSSRTQRARWEGGRLRMARAFVPRLLRRAVQKRDPVALDLALDLLVPPLAILLVTVGLGFALSIVFSALAGHRLVAAWIWGSCAIAIVAYGIRGWMLSNTGLRGLASLAYVPVFVIWKLTLPRRGSRGSREWIRTTREGEAP